jgi:hypothetical protein
MQSGKTNGKFGCVRIMTLEVPACNTAQPINAEHTIGTEQKIKIRIWLSTDGEAGSNSLFLMLNTL